MRYPTKLRMLIVLLSLAAAGQDTRKNRVAVLDFEYGTVRSEVSNMFGSDVDIGRGMAALLVKHLVIEGAYTVIEQKLVQTALSQQDVPGNERSDLAGAARIGRQLGVDAIIVGTITEFGGEHKKKSIGSGGSGYGGGAFKRESRKAVVAVNARFINIDSGEVFAVADARGISSRSANTTVSYGTGTEAGFAVGAVDFTTSGFLETIIGEATKDAISRLAQKLIAANPNLTAQRRAALEGLVAFADASTVVLNVGSRSGVRPGDTFTIERIKQEIRDPQSGVIVRKITEKIGEVRVTEADDLSAVCAILTGTQFRIGDLAKPSSQKSVPPL